MIFIRSCVGGGLLSLGCINITHWWMRNATQIWPNLTLYQKLEMNKIFSLSRKKPNQPLNQNSNPNLDFFDHHRYSSMKLFSRQSSCNHDQKKMNLTSQTWSSLLYFLGSNDNIGNLITPIQYKDDNFDEWACDSHVIERKMEILDCWTIFISKLTSAKRLTDWSTILAMLVSWLLNIISPHLRSLVSFFLFLFTTLMIYGCISNNVFVVLTGLRFVNSNLKLVIVSRS